MKRTIDYLEDGSAALTEIHDEAVVRVEVSRSVEQEEVTDDAEWTQHHKNLKTGKPIIGRVRKNRLKQG